MRRARQGATSGSNAGLKQSQSLDREKSKHAVGRLVIQFRIERMTTRMGWIGLAIFVLALLLAVLQKPIIRMIS